MDNQFSSRIQRADLTNPYNGQLMKKRPVRRWEKHAELRGINHFARVRQIKMTSDKKRSFQKGELVALTTKR